MCIHVGAHFVHICMRCVCIYKWIHFPVYLYVRMGLCIHVCAIFPCIFMGYVCMGVYIHVCAHFPLLGMCAWACVYMCVHASLCMEYLFVSVCIDVEIRG